jgi:hypothetical protein
MIPMCEIMCSLSYSSLLPILQSKPVIFPIFQMKNPRLRRTCNVNVSELVNGRAGTKGRPQSPQCLPFHNTMQTFFLYSCTTCRNEYTEQEMGFHTIWRFLKQKGATSPLSIFVGNGLLWLPSSGPNGRLGHGLRTHLLLESY